MLESNERSLALPELPGCGERLRYLGVPFVHQAELKHGIKGLFFSNGTSLFADARAVAIIAFVDLCVVGR